jgi:hypothetical protein
MALTDVVVIQDAGSEGRAPRLISDLLPPQAVAAGLSLRQGGPCPYAGSCPPRSSLRRAWDAVWN